MYERFYEWLAKIIRAVSERSKDKLEEIVGQRFVKVGDGNTKDFQIRKASGAKVNSFTTIDKKDETHLRPSKDKGEAEVKALVWCLDDVIHI